MRQDIFEPLETRKLLSASVANGTLSVIGTSKNDIVVLTQDSKSVFVSENGGALETFASKGITLISVSLGGGDDQISMQKKNGTQAIHLHTSVIGGAGDDTLVGGRGSDTLSGGAGDDWLDGGTNVDQMIGGPGNDTTDYSRRTAPVTVSVDGVANDGEANEFDNVQTEKVIGGSGDDRFVISADDPGNEVFGGPGIDTVDYSNLPVVDGVTNLVSLDDQQNDGVNQADNIHSDIENIYGSKLPDVLTGDAADNVLLGNDGNDEIHGGDGNDTISGGADEDTSLGEGGDDFVINGDASTVDDLDIDFVDGGDGVDYAEDDPIDGDLLGIETQYADVSRGSNSQPADAIQLVASFKTESAAAPVTLNGTSGADKIVINQNATVISWVINGVATTVPKTSVSEITVECAGGNDLVVMMKGDGTNAVQVPTNVSGGNGNDSLKAGDGRDTLGGGNGNDLLLGNGGNDSLVGGNGNDNVQGGAGNDILNGDTSEPITGGNDNLSGGDGNDTVDYSQRVDDLTINLADNLPNDGGDGEQDNVMPDVENVLCGTGNDSVTGNASANFISGNSGNDSLIGGDGADKLIGGDGNDTVQGQVGTDLMFLSDGTADKFDTTLTSGGVPVGDFVNGDANLDVSLTSNRKLSVGE